MALYKPLQKLKLVYNQNRKLVKTVSNINFLTDKDKKLTRVVTGPPQSAGLADYLIEYYVRDDVDSPEGNTFKDLVEFNILSNWTPETSAGIKEQVAKAVKADLMKKQVLFYRVTTVVYLEDGSTGGKVTTTISDNGDIVID